MAEQYGKTWWGKVWWGKVWLQALANIDEDNRLPRGKTYANKGAVLSIKFHKNHIDARVQGSGRTPYKTELLIPTFTQAQIKLLMDEIAKRPAMIAKLLQQELDQEVLHIADSLGLTLFPTQWRDFDMHCSCPDYAVPCKHLAALVYKMSVEIDNNPFLVFDLHGVDLVGELKARGMSVVKTVSAIPSLASILGVTADAAPPTPAPATPAKASKAIKAAEKSPTTIAALPTLDYSALTSLVEPLCAMLAEAPAFHQGKVDFREIYLTRLQFFSRQVQQVLQGKKNWGEILGATPAWSINPHSTLQISLTPQGEAVFQHQEGTGNHRAFLAAVAKIPPAHLPDYQPSVVFCHHVWQMAVHLIANGAVVPQIINVPDSTPNGGYQIQWLPAMLSPLVRSWVQKLAEHAPDNLFIWQMPRAPSSKPTKAGEAGFTAVAIQQQVGQVVIGQIITALVHALYVSLENHDKLRRGNSTFSQDNERMEALFFKQAHDRFQGTAEQSLPEGIHRWLQPFYLSQGEFTPQIRVESIDDEDEQTDDEAIIHAPSFRIHVDLLDHRTSPGAAASAPTVIALPALLTQKQHEADRFAMLQCITSVSRFVVGLDAHINRQGKTDIVLSGDDFLHFLMQMVPALQLMAVRVLLPKALQTIFKPKPTLRIKAKASGEAGQSFVRLDDMLDFDWQIAIGEQTLSEREFSKLLRQSNGLIKYKSHYIAITPEDIGKLQKYFSEDKKLSSAGLLSYALAGEYEGANIALSEEVLTIIDTLREIKDIPLPDKMTAQLRPYQLRGYAWMVRNAMAGFGSVIADDMGLGKTLQVIALLQKLKDNGSLNPQNPALIIMPTALLFNWQAELNKFAPDLVHDLYYGAERTLTLNAEKADEKTPVKKNRKKAAEAPSASRQAEIILTTYGIARRDLAQMKQQHWCVVVVDEAQNIKNVATEQTKAIKSIKGRHRIAISGTPVENRLSELWSIMDFCNPGYLGNLPHFNKTYSNPIQIYHNQAAADNLKKATAPFLMRRLKSDKSIIADLPDKVEMDCYATLTKEQASLYQSTLKKALEAIESIKDKDSKSLFKRQGLVLQMIMALKQICNHPTQFLKNEVFDSSLSGKIDLMWERLDPILATHEKALIFTQFSEMGALLARFIAERYQESHGLQPLFYHGGIATGKRQAMIERFQNNPADKVLILSLKAGGTGLNLTAANHVIHYDLWWNPAVEAQATDRAYRIGQKQKVMVHRFITKNTFEEKINAMIEAKKTLTAMTVATGESWIGNMSNTELRAIFSL